MYTCKACKTTPACRHPHLKRKQNEPPSTAQPPEKLEGKGVGDFPKNGWQNEWGWTARLNISLWCNYMYTFILKHFVFNWKNFHIYFCSCVSKKVPRLPPASAGGSSDDEISVYELPQAGAQSMEEVSEEEVMEGEEEGAGEGEDTDEEDMDDDEDEWEDEEDITDEDEEESRYALPPESHSSDSESDQSSEEDQPPPSPRRGRGRRPMMCTPGSDNDPSEPCPQDALFTRDRHGWSRKLNKVKVHRFRGPKPRGPTFERPLEDQPLLYFLMFSPCCSSRK